MLPSGMSCDSSRNRWLVRAARAGATRSRTRATNHRASRAVPTTPRSVPEEGVRRPRGASHREVQLPQHTEARLVAAAGDPVFGEDRVQAGLAAGEEEPGDAEPAAVAGHLP